MPKFKDHFSSLATGYATYRPEYPAALFKWLSSLCTEYELAWDCATGNGQAAKCIAEHFEYVIATDASAEQIAQAQGADNIVFRVASAEQSGLKAHSVDLLVVAQAAHWFDLDKFYVEAKRVLKPNGIIVLITYAHHRVNAKIDVPSLHYYHDVVGQYWPRERKWVENGYRDLPFPFTEIPTPEFKLEAYWSLPHFVGYQATWSATKRYVESTGHNPIPELQAELAHDWGAPETLRKIEWPLSLRVGRLELTN